MTRAHLFIFFIAASLAAGPGCSLAKRVLSGKKGHGAPVVDRDVPSVPVDEKVFEAQTGKLAPLAFAPDTEVDVHKDALSYGVQSGHLPVTLPGR